MKPVTYSSETWAEIRGRFEAGESASSLARTPDYPSKPAILKKAKREGWQVSKEFPSQFPADIDGNALIAVSSLGRDLPANRAAVVQILGNGGTYKLAAAAIGVSDRTLRDWREKDAGFAAKCDAAKAADMVEVMAAIKRMSKTDFAAAKFRAERHVLTRDEYAPPVQGVRGNYGNTFNVLGHIDLGIVREEPPPLNRVLEHEGDQ